MASTTSAQQWEVVGKAKPKKAKPGSQALSKSQKKQLVEKMPRIEPLGNYFYNISSIF